MVSIGDITTSLEFGAGKFARLCASRWVTDLFGAAHNTTIEG